MIVLRPISTKLLPHKDTTLFWFEGIEQAESREFFVRGAISWPEEFIQGYALLAGQDPVSKMVVIFEEYGFWTVGAHEQDGTLKHPGLERFLADTWAKYHCQEFYWHQHPEIHRRYSLQVYTSAMILPKPELIEVPIVDNLGDALILEYGRLGKLHADQRADLKIQMEKHFAVPEAKAPGPGVHALRCLLAGFEHVGWTEPRSRDQERVVYV